MKQHFPLSLTTISLCVSVLPSERERDADLLSQHARSLLDCDHFFEGLDLDEDLLDDEGLDDMFSADLSERDIARVLEVS